MQYPGKYQFVYQGEFSDLLRCNPYIVGNDPKDQYGNRIQEEGHVLALPEIPSCPSYLGLVSPWVAFLNRVLEIRAQPTAEAGDIRVCDKDQSRVWDDVGKRVRYAVVSGSGWQHTIDFNPDIMFAQVGRLTEMPYRDAPNMVPLLGRCDNLLSVLWQADAILANGFIAAVGAAIPQRTAYGRVLMTEHGEIDRKAFESEPLEVARVYEKPPCTTCGNTGWKPERGQPVPRIIGRQDKRKADFVAVVRPR